VATSPPGLVCRWPRHGSGLHRSCGVVLLASVRACDPGSFRRSSPQRRRVPLGISWPMLASCPDAASRRARGAECDHGRNHRPASGPLLTSVAGTGAGVSLDGVALPQRTCAHGKRDTATGCYSDGGDRSRRTARCGRSLGARLRHHTEHMVRPDDPPTRSHEHVRGCDVAWYALLASRSPLVRNRGASPGLVSSGAGHLVARIIP
jgi:hypothetical protein